MIAYHVRQSFHPDDKITPQVANEIGYKLAEKLTHGNHAFIVATHTDKAHIHNHIIFNSTNLTCDKKFRDFLGSGKAVGRISDRLCLEYGLSIVENPKKSHKHYGKWLDENGQMKLSHSERLRQTIYEVTQEKPADFEEFLKKMEERGYAVKRGKHLAFKNEEMGKFIRLRSLGADFSEENLRAVVGGTVNLSPPKVGEEKVDFIELEDSSLNLLIDIDKALQEKGAGYQNWAKKFNLKQMAKTVNYLTENNLMDYKKLQERTKGVPEKLERVRAELKGKEGRLAEIKEVQSHIIHYVKTKEIYNAYHKSGYSKKFKEQHEGEILLHETARDFFKDEGYKTFPKMADLKEEYATLTTEKNALYKEYYALKDETKDLLIAKANIEVLLDIKKENEKDKDTRETRS